MLKHRRPTFRACLKDPAAFRRLCVETRFASSTSWFQVPAAFRRLCVETIVSFSKPWTTVPAAFRRLCVETIRALVCSLIFAQPPSGGCVLKLGGRVECHKFVVQPPSGGCVLKHRPRLRAGRNATPSRLQAAVC